jgi:hypothetical protein
MGGTGPSDSGGQDGGGGREEEHKSSFSEASICSYMLLYSKFCRFWEKNNSSRTSI